MTPLAPFNYNQAVGGGIQNATMLAQLQGLLQNQQLQRQKFSQEQQQANTDWLRNATGQVLQNPDLLPTMAQEAQKRGILDPSFDPSQATIEDVKMLHDQLTLGQPQPEPTTLAQNLRLAGVDTSTPEGQQFVQDILLKPQTQVSIGENKPLGASAVNYRNAQGEPASAMDTVASATARGYKPVSAEQLKNIQTAQATAPTVAGISNIAFGGKGQKSLFPTGKKSFMDRISSGLSAQSANVMQTDPRIVSYYSMKNAMISNIARIGGQTGVLTDPDVARMESLFPSPGFTPETVAREQFKTMASMLLSKGMTKDQLKQAGMADWMLGLPKGIPQGSVYIGNTPDGKPVYQSPNGEKHIPDEI